MKQANRILAVVMMVFAGAAFARTFSFPEVAAFWPRRFSLLLFALSLLLYLDTYWWPNREADSRSPFSVLQAEGPKVGFSLLMTLVYLLLMNPLGFLITTPVYVTGLSYFTGYRDKRPVVVLGLVATVVVFLLFQKLLNVPLPPGLLRGVPFFSTGGMF